MDLPYKWILGNVVIIATRQRAFHAVFPRRANHVVHVPVLNSLAMVRNRVDRVVASEGKVGGLVAAQEIARERSFLAGQTFHFHFHFSFFDGILIWLL